MRILMVGLDAAGKTTILYKLKLGEGACVGCRRGDVSLPASTCASFLAIVIGPKCSLLVLVTEKIEMVVTFSSVNHSC
jgi:ADP-ribosylation factor family